MTMDKKELTLERGWTLAELERRFKETFQATLRIYDERKRVGNSTLHIEEFGNVTVNSITIRESDLVGEVEMLLQQAFGLIVRIYTPDDWTFAPKEFSLNRVRKIPRGLVHPDMEALKKNTKK